MNQIAAIVQRAHERAVAAWAALPQRGRLAALAVAGALALALVVVGFNSGRSCGERSDVETRVAMLTAGMQSDAASGKITIDELASRVKKANAAATAFETAKDLGAYCEALDALGKEFKS